MTFADAPELMTVEETAEVLRLSPRSIYERLRLGQWNDVAFKTGSEWRIDRDALKERLMSGTLRKKQPAADPMPKGRARFEAELDAELRRAS